MKEKKKFKKLRITQRSRKNDYGPFIRINLALESWDVLEILAFDLGQNVEVENSDRGAAPAAKSTIEGFPTVTVCHNEVDNGDALCVICREMVSIGESARQLPCKHMFHCHCMLQWLENIPKLEVFP